MSQITLYPENTQLLIRNTRGGLVWQVYTIRDSIERDLLEKTARTNGFQGFCIEYESTMNETWPNWRDSEVWQARYANAIEEMKSE